MTTLYELKKDALEEAQSRYFEEGKDKPEHEVLDTFHEIVDGRVPVYNGDLLQLACDNLWLACEEPEYVPGEITVPRIISMNVFQSLLSEVHSRFYEVQSMEAI